MTELRDIFKELNQTEGGNINLNIGVLFLVSLGHWQKPMRCPGSHPDFYVALLIFVGVVL